MLKAQFTKVMMVLSTLIIATLLFAPAPSWGQSSIRDLININEIKSATLSYYNLGSIRTKQSVSSTVYRDAVTWMGPTFKTKDCQGGIKSLRRKQATDIFYPKNLTGTPHVIVTIEPNDDKIASYNGSGYSNALRVVENANHNVVVVRTALHDDYMNTLNAGCSGSQLLSKNSVFFNSYLLAMNPPAGYDALTFGNNPLILAKENLYAIQLAHLFMQSKDRVMGDVALSGHSKNGYGTWMASAIDSRIKIANPSGWWHLDLIDGFTRYEYNHGCNYRCSTVDFCKDYDFDIDILGTQFDVEKVLEVRNWLGGSGSTYNNLFSISSFQYLLYPEFIYIGGEFGNWGTHDGQIFPSFAETNFLDQFSINPYLWRYDRTVGSYSGSDTYSLDKLAALVSGVTNHARIPTAKFSHLNWFPTYYPPRITIFAQFSGNQGNIASANVKYIHAGKPGYNHLGSDKVKTHGMKDLQNGTWRTNGWKLIDAADASKQMSFYIEATKVIDGLTYRTTTPVYVVPQTERSFLSCP